jgi:hypothetical protein
VLTEDDPQRCWGRRDADRSIVQFDEVETVMTALTGKIMAITSASQLELYCKPPRPWPATGDLFWSLEAMEESPRKGRKVALQIKWTFVFHNKTGEGDVHASSTHGLVELELPI